MRHGYGHHTRLASELHVVDRIAEIEGVLAHYGKLAEANFSHDHIFPKVFAPRLTDNLVKILGEAMRLDIQH